MKCDGILIDFDEISIWHFASCDNDHVALREHDHERCLSGVCMRDVMMVKCDEIYHFLC